MNIILTSVKLGLLGQTLAFGGNGHIITGIIAQNYLNPKTASLVNSIIEPKYNGLLQNVVNWADSHRSGNYSYTYNYHFVDTVDNCTYVDERDCAAGACNVGAIGNYTSRLDCKSNAGLESSMVTEALYFLVHFIGDLHQPLHVCGRSRGGNDESGNFNGKTVNIHKIWDTTMLTKRMAEMYNGNTTQIAQQLIKNIDSRQGEYANVDSWISNVVSEYKVVNSLGHWVVPIAWATDSNAYNCKVVWPSFDSNPKQDLAKEYYENAIGIVEVELARAGYRIAAVLNKALSSC